MNLDDLLAPSGAVFNYKAIEVGADVQGVVAAVPEVMPHNVFGTQDQQLTRSGKKMWKMKVVLETSDGVKTLWLEKSAYWAFVHAVKSTGVRSFADIVGYAFKLQREDDTPSATAGFQPSKNFGAKLKKLDD